MIPNSFLQDVILENWFRELNEHLNEWNDNSVNNINSQISYFNSLKIYNESIYSHLKSTNIIINETVNTLLSNKYELSTDGTNNNFEIIRDNLTIHTDFLDDIFGNITNSLHNLNEVLQTIGFANQSNNISYTMTSNNIQVSSLTENFKTDVMGLLESLKLNNISNSYNEVNFTNAINNISTNGKYTTTIASELKLVNKRMLNVISIIIYIGILLTTFITMVINYYLLKYEKSLFNNLFANIADVGGDKDTLIPLITERDNIIEIVDTMKYSLCHALENIMINTIRFLANFRTKLFYLNMTLFYNNKIWITFFSSIIIVEVFLHSMILNINTFNNNSTYISTIDKFIQTNFQVSNDAIYTNNTGFNFTTNNIYSLNSENEFANFEKSLIKIDNAYRRNLFFILNNDINNSLLSDVNGILINKLDTISSTIKFLNKNLKEQKLQLLGEINFTSMKENVTLPISIFSKLDASKLLVSSSINEYTINDFNIETINSNYLDKSLNESSINTYNITTQVIKNGNSNTSVKLWSILPVLIVALLYSLLYNGSLNFT
ncbi:hypothetical protein TPHA_0C01300 [Tetrapisispora phaffii CBS 4417]|uniref:Uncharacterized protein n=1 Tax=Tetrapisispora phaffii (strain ATCC 24235 / CBS 4417 / NBRC 1672 / NRRL Y-8282 / UCD 70-5) TaxID=1071381 RepID=G8BRB0_TETPH|nr:hypothetical protein TPHA_0C01300 [Tetrapisispora phaffii CBS 4417]CCE62286.1 hypothetical protein TPHA_0C01300 [Tetrapisispora phaffii CBS 4417]